jgi:hypothetical protein
LPEIVREIECSHCGAPLPYQPGEVVATCGYCGFTSVIQTGKAFDFEHALILNEYEGPRIPELVAGWMRGSFAAPKDLASKARVDTAELVYLPFWLFEVRARTSYTGIFERISPPVKKESVLDNEYEWLVLARRGSDFPTRSYKVPLEGKIPYDFTRVGKNAKVLNSEMELTEAMDEAKEQIESLHLHLLRDQVDRIIDSKTEFEFDESSYIHAPFWFVNYTYRQSRYELILDGATGAVIKGDLPLEEFKVI